MNQPHETEMVHFECNECDTTATMVWTPTAVVAWRDHLATHPGKSTSRSWTWFVRQLDFEAEPQTGQTVRAVAATPRRL